MIVACYPGLSSTNKAIIGCKPQVPSYKSTTLLYTDKVLNMLYKNDFILAKVMVY